MSIAGGFDQAIINGQSIHCTAIQIFTKSNRQWAARPIEPSQVEQFISAQKASNIKTVVAHASYLINLGSSNPETIEKSRQALAIELQRCDTLAIPYLVLHPGSGLGGNPQDALKQIASLIDEIIEETKPKCMILLENMAGQGSALCSKFEQLAELRQLSRHKRSLGFCFDTCHAFAAGYDLRNENTYHALWHEFDTTIGIEHLKIIHLNDSKKELGACRDRHEDIGQGLIGLEGFALLMNDKKLFDVPKILETPRDTLEDYARNMQVLNSLLTKETKKLLGL
ncbi:putative endonuclease 4 [Candidatus Dependentiae bacterium Noda2021]|nr:putative endonuclease 4 [Candidatus Dependentiae bacterium Noda2021]